MMQATQSPNATVYAVPRPEDVAVYEIKKRGVVDEPSFYPYSRQPYRRKHRKIGRNEPCPCGSGVKFKRCHGAPPDLRAAPDPNSPRPVRPHRSGGQKLPPLPSDEQIVRAAHELTHR